MPRRDFSHQFPSPWAAMLAKGPVSQQHFWLKFSMSCVLKSRLSMMHERREDYSLAQRNTKVQPILPRLSWTPFLNYMVLSGVRGGWQGLTALISDGEMSGNLELRVVTLLQRVVGMRCCIGKSIRYVGHEQRKISMFCQSRHALRLCNSIR